jgi:hypothetical protein
MLNSIPKFASARFSIVSSPLFSIQFSIHHSVFSIAKDYR